MNENISKLDIFNIIFEKQRLKPKTNKIFDMFDPITFPIESSGDSLIIASIETSNSGNEVPKPTTIIQQKNLRYYIFSQVQLHLIVTGLLL